MRGFVQKCGCGSRRRSEARKLVVMDVHSLNIKECLLQVSDSLSHLVHLGQNLSQLEWFAGYILQQVAQGYGGVGGLMLS